VSAAKVILDSLVNLEILADDTAEHIELHVSQRKGSQKITVISLTGNAMLPAPPRGAVSPSPSAF
jgi:hypothetical protein